MELLTAAIWSQNLSIYHIMITYDPDTGFRIHHHTPAPGREGEVMTAEELRLFAIDCLKTEYAEARCLVRPIHRISGAEADFSLMALERRGVANVIVTTDPSKGVEYTRATPQGRWALDMYRKYGDYPRLVLARPYLDENTPVDLASMRCGCDCFFAYRPLTLLPAEDEVEEQEGVTEIDLAVRFRDALQQGDYSVVEPYLPFDFRLLSEDWFDELPCRIEALDYLRTHAERIKSRPETAGLKIGRRRRTRRLIVYGMRGADLVGYHLEISEGMIREVYFVYPSDDIEEIDPEDNIFQSHGDHLDGISTASVVELLPSIIREARLAGKAHTAVTTDTMTDCVTDVTALRYGEGDLTLLLLLALDSQAGQHLFMTLYPSMSGAPVRITIDKVIEWDNQVEATILGTVGESSVCFFATDYYAHKDVYRCGHAPLIDLAALGLSIQRTEEKFSYTGKEAASFRQKIGQAPEYNEDGSVKPVDIFMHKAVACLPTGQKTPDVSQFMSPVRLKGTPTVLETPFFRVEMTLLGSLQGEGARIPLYFRQDMLPDLRSEDSINGVLWLTGAAHVVSDL